MDTVDEDWPQPVIETDESTVAARRRELGARTGLRVASADAFGVDPDAREALCFAWLARCALLERPSTAPGVTGARSGRILGSIHPGAPIPR